MKDSNIYKVKSNSMYLFQIERWFLEPLQDPWLYFCIFNSHFHTHFEWWCKKFNSTTLMMSLKRDQNWNEKVRRDFFFVSSICTQWVKISRNLIYILKLSSTIQFTCRLYFYDPSPWVPKQLWEIYLYNKVYTHFVKKDVCGCFLLLSHISNMFWLYVETNK